MDGEMLSSEAAFGPPADDNGMHHFAEHPFGDDGQQDIVQQMAESIFQDFPAPTGTLPPLPLSPPPPPPLPADDDPVVTENLEALSPVVEPPPPPRQKRSIFSRKLGNCKIFDPAVERFLFTYIILCINEHRRIRISSETAAELAEQFNRSEGEAFLERLQPRQVKDFVCNYRKRHGNIPPAVMPADDGPP
eukprot:scaffold2286_cov240-Pinguiococcus_pyrenoidosus.AAC.6